MGRRRVEAPLTRLVGAYSKYVNESWADRVPQRIAAAAAWSRVGASVAALGCGFPGPLTLQSVALPLSSHYDVPSAVARSARVSRKYQLSVDAL
jgi:hypothetical protein